MRRFYVFKDGTQQGSTATREEALRMIRCLQKQETHPFLKAEFSLIAGEEEFISYSSPEKEIFRQMSENETETELGEYQTWVYLKSGRSFEICYESHGLEEDKRFYSIRLHCSEQEFANGAYHSTCGIVYSEALLCGSDLDEVKLRIEMLLDNFGESVIV